MLPETIPGYHIYTTGTDIINYNVYRVLATTKSNKNTYY